MNRPIGIDLFCGVGGMSLGFEQAGFDVVAAFDSDANAIRQHKINFPTCSSREVDLASATGAQLRSAAGIGARMIDVVFGGPPCQAFSVIGRREHNDARRHLLRRFAELTTELRPRYFVLENVPGLLKPSFGGFLADVVEIFRRSGYSVLQPIQDLNAADFGVPQIRRRVFICGWLEESVAMHYPEPSPGPTPTVDHAIGDLLDAGSLDRDVFAGSLPPIPSSNVYAQWLRGSLRDPEDRSLRTPKEMSELSGCKVSHHTQAVVDRFSETPEGKEEPISRYFRLPSHGLSNTTRAGTDETRGSYTAARQIHPSLPRCITVREAARLHSFPDWVQFDPTIWRGFRQVGNAVPPLLARAVAREVMKAWRASALSVVLPDSAERQEMSMTAFDERLRL